jgi:SAM-dependent methyltransferase
MTYRDSAFDVVVASLVLMWIDELEAACRELERVTCPGGRVVVALVHPFAYRTGVVDDDGTFRVTRRYGAPFVLEDLYIAGSVGPFRYFHRPLSDYLNALAATGLQLRAFHEWSIDMTDYINHVQPLSDHPRRTDRVPMYAFLAWEKPAP